MDNGLFWRIICRNPAISHPQRGVRDPKLGVRNNCWHPRQIPEDFTTYKAATRLINSSTRVSYRSKQLKTNISPFISYARSSFIFFCSCCEKMGRKQVEKYKFIVHRLEIFFFPVSLIPESAICVRC